MKKIHTLTVAILMACTANSSVSYAQGMAVNTSSAAADGSAMLDVSSTSQGVLVPRMTATQRGNISNPATGLLVYQTDGTTGFYYNSGTPGVPNWVSLNALSNVTTQGNTFNGNNQLVKTNGSGELPAISGTNVTSLNGANITNGTVTVNKINATGTASATTYLNGSGAWSTPAGGGGGATTPALITDAGATPITTDFSANTTSKAFVVDRNGTTGSFTVNLKLPASSNYVDGDILFVAFAGSGGGQGTINLFMPGVTNLLSYTSNSAVDVSSTYTLTTGISAIGFKLIRVNSTTWVRTW